MTEEKLTYTPTELLGKEVPYPYPHFYKVRVITHRVYGCCQNIPGSTRIFRARAY